MEYIKLSSDGNTHSDQLSQYLDPLSRTLSAPRQSPINTILASQVQLVAQRFDAKRSILILCDQERLCKVAESTKVSNVKHCTDENLACHVTSIHERSTSETRSLFPLIQQTVVLTDDAAPRFEIPDLLADERFRHIALEHESAHLKYYCGVPLRTSHGRHIGALCAIDDQAHPSKSEKDIECESILYDSCWALN